EEVATLEPVVETIESVPAGLGLAAQIATEQGHRYVAAEAASRGSTERHTLAGKTVVLQQTYDGALSAVALVTRCAAAGHDAHCLGIGNCRTSRSAGIGAFLVICFMKNATPRTLHSSRRERAQAGTIRRALGPLSPPQMIQSGSASREIFNGVSAGS